MGPAYLALLFAYMGCMEGVPLMAKRDLDVSHGRDWITALQTSPLIEKVSKTVPDSYLGGCVFWPMANMLNFAFVPPHMRVPYLASCNSVFNCFLSCLNARSADHAGTMGAVMDLQTQASILT